MIDKLNKKDEQIDGLKKNVETLESTLQKAEQDKQTKDNQIKTLNTEMARQEETIGKLNKDKKALEETIKKTQSDLAAEEDKVNQLNKLKQKLEQNIDEVGDVGDETISGSRCESSHNLTENLRGGGGWSLRSAGDGSPTAVGIVGCGVPRVGLGIWYVYHVSGWI